MSFQDVDSGPGYGVEGTSNTRIGVIGRSNSGPGVLGETQMKVEGSATISALPIGVMGFAQAGVGVEGVTQDGSGVGGGSVKGTGVYGMSSEAVGVHGVSGQSDGVQGAAVDGAASGVRGTHKIDGNGVSGLSQGGNGVYGQSDPKFKKSGKRWAQGFLGTQILRVMECLAIAPADLPVPWDIVMTDSAFSVNRPIPTGLRDGESSE